MIAISQPSSYHLSKIQNDKIIRFLISCYENQRSFQEKLKAEDKIWIKRSKVNHFWKVKFKVKRQIPFPFLSKAPFMFMFVQMHKNTPTFFLQKMSSSTKACKNIVICSQAVTLMYEMLRVHLVLFWGEITFSNLYAIHKEIYIHKHYHITMLYHFTRKRMSRFAKVSPF